jgi:two-component system sensor histidine kinase RegB
MGLGLFLTRAVLERLGGSLAIESRCGEGTQVSLSLPAATPRAEGASGPAGATGPRP